MSKMNCSEFLNHIDEWIEGQEVPGARDHSRACSDCRGLAEDLGTIRLAAVTLPEDDPEISPRVWDALRTQLEQEGLIRTSLAHPVARSAGWFDSVFSFIPRPALATAYVGALVVGGFFLTGPVRMATDQERWLERTQRSTAELNAQLESAEKDAVASMANFSPDVTADLRKNLSIVDNDIALCEKSVQEEPESEIARDYLYSAYQQKADLLAQISEHGDESR
ncbi:MAG TPA: hypothetical protein VMB47_14785 [Candidatus Aquilonibacter sp.]|nr:hypothetical protein [Candidatus Aquilonibacter sp.]